MLTFNLLLMALVPCLASPVVHITVYSNNQAASLQDQHRILGTPKISLKEVLATIDAFQKNSSEIGKAALALPKFPESNATDDEKATWFSGYEAIHEKLKKQTDDVWQLGKRLESDGRDTFSVNDTVTIFESFIKVLDNFNQTELDPLVQLSKSKVGGEQAYRDLFFRKFGNLFGGMEHWSTPMQEFIYSYTNLFSRHKDLPEKLEEQFWDSFGYYRWNISAAAYGVGIGEWPTEEVIVSPQADSIQHISL